MTNLYQVIVPHVGEGIKAVQVTRFLTSEGDWIEEDKNLVEIETDKSVMEIPSIASGKVKRILCKAGDTVAVGCPLIEIESNEGNKNVFFSSQVRRGEKQKDIDSTTHKKLCPKQEKLAKNLIVSSGVVIEGFIEKTISFEIINNLRHSIRASNPKETPSCLSIFAYAIMKSIYKFDKFKCQLDRMMNIIEPENICIGIAVAGDMDTLDIMTVSYSNLPSLSLLNSDISSKVKSKIGRSQGQNASLVISDMSSYGVQRANPVVVYPSIATLFIGSPYYGFDKNGQISKLVNLCMSFDHRCINGAYAANFLNDIEKNINLVSTVNKNNPA